MALSCGVIVLLFFLSNAVPLQTVNWLIRNMAGYLVFAAIVLFQSDIRRALSHFGRAPFFRIFTKPETDAETIEEVVVAARVLASRKIGGILALGRGIALRNYIENGIPAAAGDPYD